jgi:hypothetical protein
MRDFELLEMRRLKEGVIKYGKLTIAERNALPKRIDRICVKNYCRYNQLEQKLKSHNGKV